MATTRLTRLPPSRWRLFKCVPAFDSNSEACLSHRPDPAARLEVPRIWRFPHGLTLTIRDSEDGQTRMAIQVDDPPEFSLSSKG
jgi:hypothetical protein